MLIYFKTGDFYYIQVVATNFEVLRRREIRHREHGGSDRNAGTAKIRELHAKDCLTRAVSFYGFSVK